MTAPIGVALIGSGTKASTTPNTRSLPILALPDFIKKALQAGKHVLSEKPVGKDIETAQDLIAWTYRDVDLNRTTWSVAENYRFFESHTYAAAEVQKLGRVLGWRVRINDNMEVGSKSYGEPSQAKLELLKLRWIAKGLISESETPWRKTPEYQGGFILDAGVHFVATLRYLLGRNNALSHLAAFTVQLRDDLPPVDTVNATLRSKTGVSDTFTISMATTFKGSGYIISCEKGTVTVFFDDDRVVVTRGSEESTQSFPNQGKGVKQEVAVWAEGLSTGTQDDRLSPKQALSDLEVIEMLLQSGKKDGASVELLLQ
ncbi:MAG: hypothetical protein M1828_006020 [Chrysothrix sp. TS-e1954]|nr:MAG: hypothetical protein M1828_006020 [Chrysothrix sp. TS-e1954]